MTLVPRQCSLICNTTVHKKQYCRTRRGKKNTMSSKNCRGNSNRQNVVTLIRIWQGNQNKHPYLAGAIDEHNHSLTCASHLKAGTSRCTAPLIPWWGTAPVQT